MLSDLIGCKDFDHDEFLVRLYEKVTIEWPSVKTTHDTFLRQLRFSDGIMVTFYCPLFISHWGYKQFPFVAKSKKNVFSYENQLQKQYFPNITKEKCH